MLPLQSGGHLVEISEDGVVRARLMLTDAAGTVCQPIQFIGDAISPAVKQEIGRIVISRGAMV